MRRISEYYASVGPVSFWMFVTGLVVAIIAAGVWISSLGNPTPDDACEAPTSLHDMDTREWEGPTRVWSPLATFAETFAAPVVVTVEPVPVVVELDDWERAWRELDDRMSVLVPAWDAYVAEEKELHTRVTNEITKSSDTILFFTHELEALLNA